MARLLALLASCAFLLAALPAAQAGTSTHPEIPDARDDVERDGHTVGDALARLTDITGAWLDRDTDGTFWVHLRIADLSGLDDLSTTASLSAQYAVTFGFGDSTRDYQVGASTGGSEYAQPAGAWRFQAEDTHTSKWVEVPGAVDLQQGLLSVQVPPAAAAKLAAGTPAHDLGAQAWSSLHRGDPQTDDWASAPRGATYDGRAGDAVAPPEGVVQPSVRWPAPMPVAPLLGLLLLLAAGWRRSTP